MKHLLFSFGGTAAVQLLNIATSILAARLLLPEGRGEMAVIMLWPAVIGTLGLFSLDQAVMYHTARRPADTGATLSLGLMIAAPLAAISWTPPFTS